MPRLILLNGAPGVGKSTLARRWVDDHGLALLLDVDVVRSLLGRRDQHRDVTPSWLAARALALAMARVHLGAGHDVVVPQYLGRPEFVGQLESVSDATDSTFLHVVLTIDAAPGRARFDARGDVPQLVGADESWEQMHARLAALLPSYPAVLLVDAGGDADATYSALCDALVRAEPGPAG